MFLYQDMKERIDYFVEKVNEPLAKAIVILAGRYPEPTRENLVHPNSLILLDILDEYLQHDTNERRRELFKAVFRIAIAKYEHSPNYRYPIDFILKEIFVREWKPWNPNRQLNYWRGD